LAGAGHEICGVASRTDASARAAARRLQAPVIDTAAVGGTGPDLILIGAADAAIEEVAAEAAPSLQEGTIVVHFSGSLALAPLKPLVDAGGRPCALHPMAACPDVEAAIRRLPGSAWGITCSTGLWDWVASLVASELDGLPVFVEAADRPVWHAAAATTANGVAALLSTAQTMLEHIGVEEGMEVLGPLAAGAVANAREAGRGAALTGPAVRGETEILELHIRALEAGAPEVLNAYLWALRIILDTARRAGRLGPPESDRVERLLEAR
jgi:predicted short-subunit dehydrogenase-like oxidoreductase (DUF2520 family)